VVTPEAHFAYGGLLLIATRGRLGCPPVRAADALPGRTA
jgi:hypothetical protein